MESTTAAMTDESYLRAALLKLRTQSNDWTLSEDAKLEVCMRTFQKRLEQRAGQLERSVLEFGLDIERTHARLGNVFNAFDGLSHSQFMEHRVCDEGDAASKADAPAEAIIPAEHAAMGLVDEADPRHQAALVREYTQLVAAGLHAAHAFPLEEPDDDAPEAPPPPAAVPGALAYPEVDLPFVIGTPEFLADDLCGLFATTDGYGPNDPRRGTTTSMLSSDGDGPGRETGARRLTVIHPLLTVVHPLLTALFTEPLRTLPAYQVVHPPSS